MIFFKSVVDFLLKQVVDSKDQVIAHLSDENKDLRRLVDIERRRAEAAINALLSYNQKPEIIPMPKEDHLSAPPATRAMSAIDELLATSPGMDAPDKSDPPTTTEFAGMVEQEVDAEPRINA